MISPAPKPAIDLTELEKARADRDRRHAKNCVLLAAVTSPDIAAELIDLAIKYRQAI